jgi:hypothetical protein
MRGQYRANQFQKYAAWEQSLLEVFMNMNRIGTGLLLTASLALGTVALAQQPAATPSTTATPVAASTPTAALDLIAGYQSIATSLEAARTSLVSDPPGALARVQGAQNLFRRLEPQIGSQKLIDAGTNALKKALSTVNQRSPVNLGAQSMLVKSILQRVMYDRLFSEMSTKRLPSAARYANTLATAFNMPSDSLNALRNAVKRNDAAKAIMSNSLKLARDSSNDKTTAYQAIVRASSHFLIVQDSPRVGDELTVSAFSSAVQSMTNGDLPGFKQGVASLLTRTQDFGKRARGIALSASNPTTSNPSSNPAVISSNPSNPSNPSTPQGTAPTTPNQPSTTMPAPVVPVAPAVGSTVNSISAELIKAGIAPNQAKALANGLAAQKVSSFSGTLDFLSASVGDALSQIQNGEVQDARAGLTQAQALFNASVKPTLDVLNPDQSAQTSKVFDATVNALGVRPVDATVLLGEVNSIKRLFKGAQPAPMQGMSASIQPWWSGALRGILFLIAALAFIYPIYLLNLAFGGKNPYWRYIGAAMVLLMIAPLLEGLSWLCSVIAQSTGIAFFDTLGSLSVLQNPIMQILWVLLLLAAAAFATAGFRGIASQFGLIRTRNQTGLSTAAASVAPAMMGAAGAVGLGSMGNNPSLVNTGMDSSDPRISSDVSVNPDRTIVEWDEEF